jgi:hypothetical protein
MPFYVATCPACSKQFRLRWRIGKRKLEFSQVIRLNCPHCGNQFEIEGVKLVIFDACAFGAAALLAVWDITGKFHPLPRFLKISAWLWRGGHGLSGRLLADEGMIIAYTCLRKARPWSEVPMVALRLERRWSL